MPGYMKLRNNKKISIVGNKHYHLHLSSDITVTLVPSGHLGHGGPQ